MVVGMGVIAPIVSYASRASQKPLGLSRNGGTQLAEDLSEHGEIGGGWHLVPDAPPESCQATRTACLLRVGKNPALTDKLGEEVL